MIKRIVTVSDVNRYVNRLLEEDYVLQDLWISGEVSNCKYHHSGHIYFTIKDKMASISSVMFARDAATLTFKLTEGAKIYARCRIAIYEKTGGYQAYVKEIETQGKGDLYEQFERLKKRLGDEGLFERKKPLPTFPKKVGVITSHTGAAIKDILNVANRRNKSIPIYIYTTHVQGEYAKEEIALRIEQANRDQEVDVLIVGRGGGSIEDLWAFNEERVARAIANSSIPIVSAVGHEVDFTIADFVSDVRAATPSAAAEIVFPEAAHYLANLEQYQELLKTHMIKKIERLQERLYYLESRPVYANKEKYFEQKIQQVDLLNESLQREYKGTLMMKRKVYENKVAELNKLSPLATLHRGYSLIKNEEGEIVTSVSQLHQGEHVELIVTDGTCRAKIDKEG